MRQLANAVVHRVPVQALAQNVGTVRLEDRPKKSQ